MSEAQARVAVIGCGFFAGNHLNAWSELDGVEIAAVCDLDGAKARAAAERFGVARWYTDAELMLRETQADFVDIITTMGSHRALVDMAAPLTRGLIVQKPFGPTYADCVHMVETAERAGIPLMVHENFRFQAPMRRVKQLIDAGTIGEPVWGRLSFRTGYDVKTGQPYLFDEPKLIVLDLGIHVLDLVRVFLGEVSTLYARHQRIDPRVRGEDMATLLLGHESGASSVIDITYESRRQPDHFPETLLEIEGREGALIMRGDCKLEISTRSGMVVEDTSTPLRTWTSKPWHVAQDSVYRTQAHWLDCFRRGVTPETSGRDNLKTYRLVDMAYESAESGRVVGV